MIKDNLSGKLGRWSLERVEYLLSHLEGLIEDEPRGLKERASTFTPESGLDKIETLVEIEPNDPRLPTLLLEQLALYFDAGLLVQRGPSGEGSNWWTTDLFWRGTTFHLELNDQIQSNRLIPDMPPLQVRRALAYKTLAEINLQFLLPKTPDADAYLIKPTPNVAYILICTLASPWSADHVTHAHRLINKCFLY